MIVAQQRKAGDAGKHGTGNPDVKILHPQDRNMKEVALHHDGEADEHAGKRQPTQDLSDQPIDGADASDEHGEPLHRFEPPYAFPDTALVFFEKPWAAPSFD
jgi:hypothetical protein